MIQKKKNECPKCGKIYILPSSLKTHLLSHNSDNRYACSECLMTFLTEIQLKEHSTVHTNKKESKNEDFCVEVLSDSEHKTGMCTLPRKDDTGGTLKELVGIYKKLYKCFECPVTFIKERDLESHLSSHSYDKGLCQKLPGNSSDESSFTVRRVAQQGVETSSEISLRNEAENKNLWTTFSPSSAVRNPKITPKTYRAARASVQSVRSQNSQSKGPNIKSPKALSKSLSENHIPTAVNLKVDCNTKKFDYEREMHEAPLNNTLVTCDKTLAKERGISLPEDIGFDCEISGIHDLEEHILKMLGLESKYLSFTSNCHNGMLMENTSDSSALQANLFKDFSILFQCQLCFMIFLDKKEIESHHHVHKSNLSDCAKRFLVPKGSCENTESPEEETVSANLNSMIRESRSSVIRIFGNVYRIYLIRMYQEMCKCLMCPMVFLTVFELRNHLSVHTHNVLINGEMYAENNTSFTDLASVSEVKEPSENYSQISNIYKDSTTYCPLFQCLECQAFFMEKSELESHSSLHTTKDTRKSKASSSYSESKSAIKNNTSSHDSSTVNVGLYVCDVCKKVFCDGKKLSDHKRIHGIRRFECEKCGKKFRSNSYLLKHMQVHSKPYHCSECGKSFKTDFVLELHKTEHLDARPHKCTKCGSTFKRRISLILHRFDHVSDGPFICDICKLTFENADMLKMHMETHLKAISDEQQPFICTECDKIFLNIKKYRYHIRCHSDNLTNKCQFCDKSFPDIHVLKRHLRIHTGERPFLCSLCDKKFAFKSSLDNHMDIHASNKLYLCHVCGISLNQRSTYYSHLKKHKGVKHHSCNICKKTFFYKGSYNRHMAMHFDKKPYQCETCGRRFKQNAHLKSHILIHTGEKPYQCHICNKSFTQKTSLVNHLLIHKEGQYRYECHECGRRVRHKSTLFRHLKIKSDGKSYWCKLCDKLFTRRSCLIHHKKNHAQDGSFIRFDGHEEIVGTFVDCSDEQDINVAQSDPFSIGENIIVTQGIPYDTQEEVIVTNGETLTINGDILLNPEITYDSHEEIIVTPIDLLENDDESLQVHLVF